MRASDLAGLTPELSDRQRSSSVASSSPRGLRLTFASLLDLVELAKLRLNLLVLLVTAVGFYLGSSGPVDGLLLLSCLLGTAMLGAGANALNQYIERYQDALMSRTQKRPLPGGRMKPFEALAVGVFLGIGGVLELALLVGPLPSILGATTFLSYVLIYTPLKRRTPHALFVGAVPGALPPLIGWSAASGELPAAAWAIAAILFVWQIPHFMAIAWLYREDYVLADFRVFAGMDPQGSGTARLTLWSTFILLAISITPASLASWGGFYPFAAIALGLGFLLYVGRFVHSMSRADARSLMLASIVYLPLLYLFLVIDKSL